jgi:C-terminal processing protease CtpA/Prc
MSPIPSRRGLAVTAGTAALLLLPLAGCASSFFKLDPDGNAAQVPARTPDTQPAAAKPDAPKPEAPKPAVPKPEAKPAAPAPRPANRRDARPQPAPPAAVATPPAERTPEPVAPPLDPDPEAIGSDSAGVARLVRLAMVWHTVGLHHPAVAGREVEWDGTLARHATATRGATDEGRLVAAYTRLLGVLGDGLTRIERGAEVEVTTHSAASADLLPDGTLLLRLAPSLRRVGEDSATVARAVARTPSRVVLDLRGTLEPDGSGAADLYATAGGTDAFIAATGLAESLISTPLALPGVRVRRTGSQGEVTTALSGAGALIRPSGTTSGWMQTAGQTLAPRAARAPGIVVIANAASVIPSAIAALVAARRATLVAEERVSDESLVPSTRVAIAPGVFVRVRTGELVHRDGTTGIHADTVVPRLMAAGDSAPALRAALRLVRAGAASPRAPLRGASAVPSFPPGSAALASDTVPYPWMGARLLGGFRVWSVMRSRHAHRESYDDDIGALFEGAIPRLEAARNRQQYAEALHELVASFDDSQVALRGAAQGGVGGPAIAPFRVGSIEGRAIVTAVDVPYPPGAPRITVGAEITSVDGFPIPAWLLEHRRSVSASNDWTRTRDLMALMPRGGENDALLRVREAAGPERAAAVPRVVIPPGARAVRMPERSTPAVSRIGADVAYLGLDEAAAIAAIAGAANARAIVLDLRGRAPAWPVVLRRLVVQPEFVVARVVGRALSTPCTVASPRDAGRVCADERVSTPVVVRLDTAGRYRGRVVALIDERTQGSVEQFALALETGANATLIGSSSAGAAADTVSMPLPGGLLLGYPTEEIRRADGGQLHRTGITPLVEVRQTVRGFRAGKDDVIERAAAWLQPSSGAGRRR